MSLGLSLYAISGASVFDPATLSLSGWWRASYSASPWVGNASAGASSGRDLTEATNPPAAGSALNGLTPADFDGTNDKLGGAAISNFLGSAFSFVALINITAQAADAGVNADPQVFCDSGSYVNLRYNTSNVGFSFFDGSTKEVTISALSTGTWTMLRGKWDGSNMYLAKNADAFGSPTASGAPDVTTGTIRSGCNYNATTFGDLSIAELMFSTTALSDADFTNIRGYLNSRYGLSL